MQNTTTIALSRLVAQQAAMDLTANNIANASTPGYRLERVLFSAWMDRVSGPGGIPGDAGLALVQDRATYRELEPGPISTTGNPLDLAIGDADGYFAVRTGAGVRLTRAGHFSLSPTGTIVDEDGDPLLDRAGQPLALTPSDTKVTVAADGTVLGDRGAVGAIGVVAPSDPTRLMAEGDHNLRADTPTRAVAAPRLVQGAIEGSNVQAVAEINRITTDLRDFQFVTQFLQGEADRRSNVIDKLSQRPT